MGNFSRQPSGPPTVKIFDTTLRDGEQSPGFSMNAAEKLRMAAKLEELGADVIEAGFPIASDGDLEGVRAVAEQTRTSKVAALARAQQADIDAALRALEPAAKPRLHIFLATSDLHLKYKLKMSRAEALAAIGEMVRYGVERCEDVEFSAEDGSRTDVDFLCEAMQVAMEAGATTLNIPDTVGYAVPEEYGALFRRVRDHLDGLGNRDGITLSTHCHNDLGLAVANSLAAVQNGARQVECTINGIGERAGNASLEEVVVAMAVRRKALGCATNVHLEKIYETSRLLSDITGVMVPPNKAVVGSNAFAHEAGIHQDGILKNPLTYEIITPEAVGVPARTMVLGKHSGKSALRVRLEELGFQPDRDAVRACYEKAMAVAAEKKDVSDRDLLEIMHGINRAQRPAMAETGAD